ncbi:MAG: hypothetical protein M0030_13065 [Actinomycetota bacterium]|nr:hypothetical protein [Actinomycetota bacterium]
MSTAITELARRRAADAVAERELTRVEAEALTRSILGCLRNWRSFEARVTELALRAYNGQAWRALGYQSWSAYASDRFGDLELPRATQAAINAALINTGQISARSASAITGTSDKTASADAARATAEDSAVDGKPPQADKQKRTGADGRKRAGTKRKPRKPQPQPAGQQGDTVSSAGQPTASTKLNDLDRLRKGLRRPLPEELTERDAKVSELTARILALPETLAMLRDLESWPEGADVDQLTGALRTAYEEIGRFLHRMAAAPAGDHDQMTQEQRSAA